MGNIEVKLFQNDAPKTVANFVGLAEGTKEFTDEKTGKKAKKPFYDGLIFHRVIKGFMLQAGCPQGNGRGGPGYSFADEINAVALGLDKLKAIDPKKGPHPFRRITTEYLLRHYFKAWKSLPRKNLIREKKKLQLSLSPLPSRRLMKTWAIHIQTKDRLTLRFAAPWPWLIQGQIQTVRNFLLTWQIQTGLQENIPYSAR
ncbi:MAG: peptidylprolyl isomerase [Deltaproteobacteria bacterium]|nr:peptidylprolyl isomerase [Deltaproteobacteria bacterium]